MLLSCCHLQAGGNAFYFIFYKFMPYKLIKLVYVTSRLKDGSRRGEHTGYDKKKVITHNQNGKLM